MVKDRVRIGTVVKKGDEMEEEKHPGERDRKRQSINERCEIER